MRISWPVRFGGIKGDSSESAARGSVSVTLKVDPLPAVLSERLF